MAFLPANFVPIGPNGNSDAPRHWSYADTAAKATIVASGYFNNAVKMGLQVNDIIWVVGVTGGTEVFFMCHIEAISAAGVVTCTSSSLTLA